MTGIFLICLSACGGSSSREKSDVEMVRFEQVLMQSSPGSLQSDIASFASQYQGHLLNVFPNNPEYMQMVAGFVADTTIRYIYDCVNEQYADLGWLEKDLRKALAKAHDLDEKADVKTISTLISAQFDYTNRTYCEGEELLIAIDQYVLPKMERYMYFGNPMYIVNLCRQEYILPDCIGAVARSLVRMPESDELSLLDIMIMEGKALYMVDQVLPDVADTLKLRYTADQLHWMQDRESDVWAYLLQQQLLYETDHTKYHNLIDEAPKTNAFRDSAPRVAAYIGWRIVDAYMNKNKCTLDNLMESTDSQAILQGSGYRPR